MELTKEQLAAMGLYAPPPPPPSPDSGGIPPILSASPVMPSSSLGGKIDPGMKIPADKMNSAAILGGHPEEVPQDEMHQAGKDAYHAAIPRISAMPGSADYYRQRQSQLDFKQAHPWGDEVSEHPGILGKIGHIAAKVGNIAGDIFAPGTMANIPGTELHNEVERAQNEHGITQGVENAGREATTAETQEATREAPSKLRIDQQKEEDVRNPALKPKEEDWSVVPNLIGPHGEVFQQEKNSGQVRPAPSMTGAKAVKEPNEPDKDKDISDYLQAYGLPDSPANREKARGAIANRGKQEPGTYMPLYDPKTGQITGAWDPKSGHLIKAPDMNGTTAAGAGMEHRATAATAKEAQPYQQMVDSAAEAHQLADMAAKGNASADVDLVLSFFKAMKGTGGQGVRFTKQEQDLILGARSAGQGLIAIAQKVKDEGQPLTPDQRTNMVAVMDMHAKAAQAHLAAMQGGQGGGPAGGQTQTPPPPATSAVPSFAEWKKSQQQP